MERRGDRQTDRDRESRSVRPSLKKDCWKRTADRVTFWTGLLHDEVS